MNSIHKVGTKVRTILKVDYTCVYLRTMFIYNTPTPGIYGS